MVWIALRLLARGKSAVVMTVELNDAPPDVLECVPKFIVAGNRVQLGQGHDRMEAFPAWLGHLEEFLSRQGSIQIVTCQRLAFWTGGGELVTDLEGEL